MKKIITFLCSIALVALIATAVQAEVSECPDPAQEGCICTDFEVTPIDGYPGVSFSNWFLLNQNSTYLAPWSPTRVAVLNPLSSSYCEPPNDDASGTITFDQPVSEVSFWYTSCLEGTLEAFDSAGSPIADPIVLNASDTDTYFDQWLFKKYLSPTGNCDIKSIRLTGIRKIDRLEFCCPPPPDGGEGCTPGYWRNLRQHGDEWAVAGIDPNDYFDSVFGCGPHMLLSDAIRLGGDGQNLLIRHGTAALLNASHPEVDFGFSPAQVIELTCNAFNTGEWDIWVDNNEAGCPLD